MTTLRRWLIWLFTRRRFCEDCRWFKAARDCGPSICTHDLSGEDDATHLVQRGIERRAKPYACSLMRRGACGRAGKLWRPK